MRAIKGTLLLFILMTLLSPAAVAGGWWSSIGLEGQPVGIGESINLKVSEVAFASMEEAEEAKGQQFFAYLVQDFDRAALDDAMARPNPGDWWTPLSEPILVGEVRLLNWDSNVAKGRAELDVPKVPPGRYYLMLCDAGCDVALGNLTPSKVNVTNDVLAAQTTRRLQKTEADLTLALQRSRSELRETRSTLRETRSDVTQQNQRINKLEMQLTDGRKLGSSPWISYTGWFLAGTAAAFSFLRRSRSHANRDQIMVEHIPEDPRELINSP